YYYSPVISQLNGGQYASFPANFEQIMESTREQLYDRVESQVIDPDQLPPGFPEPGELNLPLTEIDNADGGKEKIYSAIIIENEGRYEAFSLLQLQPTIELGPEGLKQSNSVNVIDPLKLEGQLAEIVIGSLGITQNIGYVADRETASFDPPNPQRPGQGANLYQFSQEARDLYNFQSVRLDEGIGKDVNILLLIDPKKQLSDWDLYQLDQFIMRGGRLVVAMEPYQIMQSPYGGKAQFIPNPNVVGVESNSEEQKQQYTLIDLLKHYGIEYQNVMVFDKSSFINRGQNPQTGGYQETQVYYIPEINTEKSSEVSFIQGLKKVFFYNSAALKVSGENSSVLLKSSLEAWTEDMSDGSKDPNNVFPPAADKLGERNLIAASKGSMDSFFKGKEIPKKPKKEKESEESEESEASDDLSLASVQDAFVEQGKNGQVLVSGTSLIFDAQLLSLP
ncbi:MAG: Gldg family protein, partial [Spirochaetota bacterium]